MSPYRAVGRTFLGAGLVLAVVTPARPAWTRSSAPTTRAADRSHDFNGDGVADLAIGAIGENVNGRDGAGAVSVIYGSPSGLASTGNQFWTQDSPGIPDRAEENDYFGNALAPADFNGDGFADLAIGVPRESDPGVLLHGAVTILYGSASGLSATGVQFWTQNSPGILDHAEQNDMFGYTLAAGDLDGDGFADLAIGAFGEGIGDETFAGAVNVLYGSTAGLTSDRNQFWSEDSPGVPGTAKTSDYFGMGLAVGDFDGNGFADLSVGIPKEDNKSGTLADFGTVTILYGSSAGLTADGTQLWAQGRDGVLDVAEDFDQFGWALATGDLNGDGFADLIVGVPYEDLEPPNEGDQGAVNVLYGSSSGLSSEGNQFWTQDSPGILDVAEGGDHFGYSVASGDLNGDSYGDLVVGVSEESFDPTDLRGLAGAVNVLYGSASGLSSVGNQFWTQDSPGILDQSELGDEMGWSVTAADYDGDGFVDMAAGDRQESVGTVLSAGATTVIYGGQTGLTDVDNQFWTQDSDGILDQAEENDLFGTAVA